MVTFQVFAFALLIVATVQARYVHLHALLDLANLAQDDFEDALSQQPFETIHPSSPIINRVRRQLGSFSTNPDGSVNLNAKVPLATGENNELSAVGSVSGLQSSAGPEPHRGYSAAGGGLALDNINGHGLTATGQHIPGLGNQATAAVRLGLINTPDHRLGANAFVTRTMPDIPNLSSFNTYGGSLDYTFKDRIGGSLGMAHTDLLKKTDYSAMANLNLFRNPSSSLDLNAGLTRSQSPIPEFNTDWHPQAGISFTKHFR